MDGAGLGVDGRRRRGAAGQTVVCGVKYLNLAVTALGAVHCLGRCGLLLRCAAVCAGPAAAACFGFGGRGLKGFVQPPGRVRQGTSWALGSLVN